MRNDCNEFRLRLQIPMLVASLIASHMCVYSAPAPVTTTQSTSPTTARDNAVEISKKWAFEFGPAPDTTQVTVLREWITLHPEDNEALYWAAYDLDKPADLNATARGESIKAVLHYLELAASGRYAPAESDLALKYMRAEDVPRDLEKAKSLLKDALRSDDPIAHYVMIFYLISEKPANADQTQRLLAHAQLAVEGGFLRAKYFVALSHIQLNAIAIGAKEMQDAAKLGDTRAQMVLSQWYRDSKYVNADDALAFEWAKRAVSEDLPDAYSNLASFYARGIGTEASPPKAFELYKRASQLGSLQGKAEAAKMYLTGFGTKLNPEEGRKLMLEAADSGNADAIFNVGRGYVEGLWIERDLVKAKGYLSRAAELGVAGAKSYLQLLDYNNSQGKKQ